MKKRIKWKTIDGYKSRAQIISEVEIDQIRNWKYHHKGIICQKNKYFFKSKKKAREYFDYCKENLRYYGKVYDRDKTYLFDMIFDEWYNIVCWHPFPDKFWEYIK